MTHRTPLVHFLSCCTARCVAAWLVVASTCISARADINTALGQLQKALLAIDFCYVDTVDADHLSEVAVRAMLKELDPHSAYLTAAEVKAQNEQLGGNFDGIGVRYQMEDDTLLIVGTIKGGPSDKLGITSGDRIVAVDDTVVAGVKMSNTEIQRRLRGPRGTHVDVTILRDGEEIEYNIVRDQIPVYSIETSYMPASGIGYIKIDRFAQTTSQEFAEAMNRLTTQGMRHLIIDLQNNGGGIMKAAIEVANMLLPSGQLIVYTEGRSEPRTDYYAKVCHKFDGRIVVIINEESASASEILAGALQDHDRAVIVGRRSFGKGLVQRPFDLPGGAMVRLTSSHYYTPSGRCIQKPYTKGEQDDYARDIADRIKRGEHLSADSIHFADSLRRQTDHGRIVYGGGGIMPDIFVPLDTTRMGNTHRALIARGTFHRYILEYFSHNQKQLRQRYPTIDDYIQDFNVTEDMIAELAERGVADSVAIDSADLAQSVPLLGLQLKANIASDLYQPGDGTRIFNTRNQAYLQALDIIRDDRRYYGVLTSRKK